jgi:hypothetical protein
VRKELKARNGRRGHFRAIFKRFGMRRYSNHAPQPTALFIEIRDESGDVVADHLWFQLGEQFSRLDLQPGDEVFFVARVKKYRKRNHDAIDDDPRFVEDYKLSYPSQVSKLGVEVTAMEEMPLFNQAAGGKG